MLTVKELNEYGRQFIEDNYKISLDIPIRINNRLTSTLGRYVVKMDYWGVKDRFIDINGTHYRNSDKEAVLDTLRHELVHYALHTLSLPYKDGQAYFENELSRLGISSNYRDNNVGVKATIKKHHYQCDKCNGIHVSIKRINVSRKMYRCRCGGDLEYKGRK